MREYPDILHGLDEDGNITDVKTHVDGKLDTENLSQTELLQLILNELRKMNIHLSILTENEIGDDDIDN